MQYNIYGRGLSLRIAIMVACQMAFILFGMPYALLAVDLLRGA